MMNRYNLKNNLDTTAEVGGGELHVEDTKPEKPKSKPLFWCLLIAGIVFLLGGVSCILYSLLGIKIEYASLNYPDIPSAAATEQVYSKLTGMPLSDAALINAPAYCIQTPNGLDGARPQAGLDQAGVIFEAIAESGITRFAAIYQNPTSAVIGPIRSLRLYYLQWDTPFDCTIVHAGGADDAIAAVRSGGYKDLSENYTYMYRGTYGSRLWNNLFTTSNYLKSFSVDYGYNSSDIKGFSRMTPVESKKSRIDALVSEKLAITKPTTKNTSVLTPRTSTINVNFGGWANYNVAYSYNVDSNTYLRSYASGDSHEVYSCPGEDLGEVNPEDRCGLVQMAPSVVIVMVVSERRAADDYHEDITTVGSGSAYIFQNGIAIAGSWHKDSVGDQIAFMDGDGKEVRLAPGQTIISAIPEYGGVDF